MADSITYVWSGPDILPGPTMGTSACEGPRRLPRCPACRREFVWQENPHRPFCSITCRLIDLGAWLDEEYSIAGEKVSDDRGPDGGG